MLINTLITENNNKVLLLDNVFGKERLSQLHNMCDQFSPGCEHWPMPEWTQGRPRYLFDRQGDEWKELVEYFDSTEFKQPLENHLGTVLHYSDGTMWCDFKGFGMLGPHKEQGGTYMMQVYLTKTPHEYSGTTIYNEAGEILAQLPYRDNFGWFFHGMEVMHGRQHDVPEGIARFTLQVWYYI